MEKEYSNVSDFTPEEFQEFVIMEKGLTTFLRLLQNENVEVE